MISLFVEEKRRLLGFVACLIASECFEWCVEVLRFVVSREFFFVVRENAFSFSFWEEDDELILNL